MVKTPTNLDICNLITETIGIIIEQYIKIIERLSKNSIEYGFHSTIYFLLGVFIAFLIVFATTEEELFLYMAILVAATAIIILITLFYLIKKHKETFQSYYDRLEKIFSK